MILVVDIGNSNIAAGLWSEERWIGHWRFSTQTSRTADEYMQLFQNALSAHMRTGQSVVVSSVVPALEEVFDQVFTRLFGAPPFLVRSCHSGGLRLCIDNPAELGTDLLANAVAGYARFSTSCIVVDFGTALSFTAVDACGCIQGVAIAPGVGTALKALAANTARLPHVKLEAPTSAIGRNTVASIQSGIVNGYAGLVEGLVGKIRSELPPPVKVVFTGGFSSVLADICTCPDEVEPWLTLEGLRLIGQREFGAR